MGEEKEPEKKLLELEVHIIPVEDEMEHTHSIYCSCGPKIYVQGNNLQVEHNALDGREHLERVQRLLNKEYTSKGWEVTAHIINEEGEEEI